MESNKDILTIDSILSSLDDAERRSELFKRLRSSEPLSDEVRGIKDFLEANDYDHEKLKAFVSSSEKNYGKILVRSNRPTYTNWLKVAAVVVPLIGISTFFYFNRSKADLYAKYYEKEIGMPVFMGLDADTDFNEAMNAYRDEDFEVASSGFETLLSQYPNNDTLLYFLACSDMELKRNDKAIEAFKRISNTSAFRQKAEYRLALSHIRSRQYAEAKQVLGSIADNPTHAYRDRAIRILDEPKFK